MPTSKELEELVKQCNWEAANQEGVNGFKVTGPSGKSIFLPYTGQYYSVNRERYTLKDETIGYYWSKTLSAESDKNAIALICSKEKRDKVWISRSLGCCIRPVVSKSAVNKE